MLFDLQVHQRDEWIVLSVVGEVDLAVVPRVRQAVIEALSESAGAGRAAPPSLVLDFGAVDLIDSSGLGVVLGALKRVRAHGGRLRVVVREPHVRRIFELTDLDQIVPVVRSVDDAIELVNATSDRAVGGG